MVKNSYSNCIATCNLTISEDNCENIEQIYDFLTLEKKIHTINPIVVRNEGVYDVPDEKNLTY